MGCSRGASPRPRLVGFGQRGKQNSLRGVLTTFTAVVAAAATLLVTIHTYRLGREGQITERMTKAVGQLDAAQRDVRVGGLHALIRLGKDSARDRPSVVAILCTFVKERTLAEDRDPEQQWDRPERRLAASGVAPGPPSDVEVALNGAIQLAQDLHPLIIQLHRAHLPGAHLFGVDLSGTNLAGITLDRAFAWQARLDGPTSCARACGARG